MTDVVFWLLSAILVASALGVVMASNLYRAAYALAATLVTTAAMYMLLTAPLLAAVQILLYTGGVLTLVVYALVMTAQSDDTRRWRLPVPAAVIAILTGLVLASFVGPIDDVAAGGGLESGRLAGIELFRRYLVPFELLSILLLGAIFGALAIARREEDRP